VTIRVGSPFEDTDRGGFVLVYLDGAIATYLRRKTLAEAGDLAAKLSDQPHRMGVYGARWERSTVRCDCGWRQGKVLKQHGPSFAEAHVVAEAEREAAAARELTGA
jgi:hypothetical protein